jgi:hypothetical protein
MCVVHIMFFVQKTHKNYLAAATGQIYRQRGERVRSGGGCCGYVRERGCWSCWFIAWNWVRIVVSLCHSPHNKQEQMITFESGLMLCYCQKTFYLFVACVILRKRGLSVLDGFERWAQIPWKCVPWILYTKHSVWPAVTQYSKFFGYFKFSFLCRALEE